MGKSAMSHQQKRNVAGPEVAFRFLCSAISFSSFERFWSRASSRVTVGSPKKCQAFSDLKLATLPPCCNASASTLIMAKSQWRQVADQLQPKLPKLAALMHDAEADVLAYMTFPKEHGVKLHASLGDIGPDTSDSPKNLGLSPDGASCLPGCFQPAQRRDARGAEAGTPCATPYKTRKDCA